MMTKRCFGIIGIALACIICSACDQPLSFEYRYVMGFQQQNAPSVDYGYALDTYLDSSNPNAMTYGTLANVTAGYNGALYRAYFRFSIHGFLPANATVKKATLTLSVSGLVGSGFGLIAQELTNVFTNATNWNTGNSISPTVIGTAVVAASSETITIDLNPAVVQNWLARPSQNYGISVRTADESLSNYVSFVSQDNGNVLSRPQLTVVYSL